VRIYKTDSKNRSTAVEKLVEPDLDMAEVSEIVEAGESDSDILKGYVCEKSDLARGHRGVGVQDEDDLLSEGESLVADSENKRIGLVIGCDANAHHHQWGSTNTIIQLFTYTRLVICNRVNTPTFIIKNRPEVLNWTLVSHSIQGCISSWKVREEHSFSDHRYMETILSLSTPTGVPFRNLKRTN